MSSNLRTNIKRLALATVAIFCVSIPVAASVSATNHNEDETEVEFGSQNIENSQDYLSTLNNSGAVTELRQTYQGADVDLLPAYRWHTDADLYARCQADGFFKAIAQFACNAQATYVNIGLDVAMLMWSLSLNVFRFALGASDLLADGSDTLFNPIFTAIYDTGVSAGILFLVAVLIFVAAARAALSGRGMKNNALRILVVGFLPLIFLQVAAGAAATEQATGRTATGSPMWLSGIATGIVSETTSALSSALMGRLSADDLGSPEGDRLSCGAYTDALEALYSSSEGADMKLVAVSRFWEGAFLPAFLDAQYSTKTDFSRTRIYCHQLEARSGTPRETQAQLGLLAGYPSSENANAVGVYTSYGTIEGDTSLNNDICDNGWFTSVLATEHHDSTQVNMDSYDCDKTDRNAWFFNQGGRRDPYLSAANASNTMQSLLMWDACSWNGSWEVQGSYSSMTLDKQRVLPEDCQLWWATGMPSRYADNPDEMKYPNPSGTLPLTIDGHGLDWSTPPAAGISEPASLSPEADAAETSLTEINSLVSSMNGNAAGSAFIMALTSAVTAFIYMIVFLGLSLAVFTSSIGATILWALLPVTLMLLALENTRETGKKMLKMTAGYTFFASFAQIFLTLALVMTTLVGSVLSSVVTENGVVGIFIQGISPVVVVFALRKIAKKVGMDGMFTPRGGLTAGMYGGAAYASAGSIAGAASGVAGKGGRGGAAGKAGSVSERIRNWSDRTKTLSQTSNTNIKDRIKAGYFGARGALKNPGQATNRAVNRLTSPVRSRLDNIAGAISASDPQSPTLAGRIRNAVANSISNEEKRAKNPLSLREAQDLSGRRAKVLNSLTKAQTELASLEDTPENAEAIAAATSRVQSLSAEASSLGLLSATAIARTDVNGEVLRDTEGNLVVSVKDRMTGLEVTQADLDQHIADAGGVFISSDFDVETVMIDDMRASREVLVELRQSYSDASGIEVKNLVTSTYGSTVLDPSLDAKSYIAAVSGTSHEEQVMAHSFNAGLTVAQRSALADLSAEQRAAFDQQVRVNLGALDPATGRSIPVIEVLSAGRIIGGSQEHIQGQIDIAAGKDSPAAKMVQRYSLSPADFDNALNQVLRDRGNTQVASIIDEAVEAYSEAVVTGRSNASFSSGRDSFAASLEKAQSSASTIVTRASQGNLEVGGVEYGGLVAELVRRTDAALGALTDEHIATLAAADIATSAPGMRPGECLEYGEMVDATLKVERDRFSALANVLKAEGSDVDLDTIRELAEAEARLQERVQTATSHDPNKMRTAASKRAKDIVRAMNEES